MPANASEQGQPLALTEQENAFLNNHPSIRFRVRPNRPPFEFEQDGKAAGIAVDYISLIAERVGFSAEFIIDGRSPPAAFNMVEGDRAEFDTLLYTVRNAERAKRFAFGDVFLSYPVMLISHKNASYIGKIADLNGRTIALEKGFLTNKWIKRDFPAIRVLPAENTLMALQMVDDQEVAAYIGNMAVANYMMAFRELDNIKITAPTAYKNVEYRFMAPKEWPELTSILSKGYKLISQQEHTAIQQRWFSLQMLDRTDYELVWRIVALAAFVVGGFYYWGNKLRGANQRTQAALKELQSVQQMLEEKNKRLKELAITDSLTSLFNREKLDEVLQNEILRSERYGTKFGLILLDIDYFKKINDEFSHQIGDKVLIETSFILKSHMRNTDTVGRWGGEEFMVICPETNLEQCEVVAEQLRSAIDEYPFSHVGHRTVSLGASCYREEDSMKTLIDRVDSALYDSKDSGRNRVTVLP